MQHVRAFVLALMHAESAMQEACSVSFMGVMFRVLGHKVACMGQGKTLLHAFTK
jgi:hypothetical protein